MSKKMKKELLSDAEVINVLMSDAEVKEILVDELVYRIQAKIYIILFSALIFLFGVICTYFTKELCCTVFLTPVAIYLLTSKEVMKKWIEE